MNDVRLRASALGRAPQVAERPVHAMGAPARRSARRSRRGRDRRQAAPRARRSGAGAHLRRASATWRRCRRRERARSPPSRRSRC